MIGGPSTSRRTPALIFTAGLPSCESLDHPRHLPLSGTAERSTVCPLAKQSATTDPAQPVSIPHNTVWSVFTPPPFAQLFASSPLVFASGGLKISQPNLERRSICPNVFAVQNLQCRSQLTLQSLCARFISTSAFGPSSFGYSSSPLA